MPESWVEVELFEGLCFFDPFSLVFSVSIGFDAEAPTKVLLELRFFGLNGTADLSVEVEVEEDIDLPVDVSM